MDQVIYSSISLFIMPRQPARNGRESAQILNDHPPPYESTTMPSGGAIEDRNQPNYPPDMQPNLRSINNSEDDYRGTCDTLFGLIAIILCFDPRLKGLHRAIIAFVWMAILATGIALSVRYLEFRPVNYDINPGDNRPLNERFSTIFCKSLTATKTRVILNPAHSSNNKNLELGASDDNSNDDETSVYMYLLTNSNLNKTLTWRNFTMKTSVPAGQYTYWRFYLNSGSRLILNYRIDNTQVQREFLAIRGNDSFSKWMKTGICDTSSCEAVYVSSTGSYDTKNITKPDTYFFIFKIKSIYILPFPESAMIQTDFKVGQTTYEYKDYTEKCNFETAFSTQLQRPPPAGKNTVQSCKFSFGFGTKEFMLIHAPFFINRANTFTRFIDMVKTECEASIPAYVLLCACVPMAFVIIYMLFVSLICSLQKSLIQSHLNWENAHEYRSPSGRNFPSERNFSSAERQPLLQEAPPSYSESLGSVPQGVPQESPPPYSQI
ncbi:unnamed protein product [Owenia fusiformis]|uniref:E3 ubiquitin-protein ligase APD1-4 N-terminal domain-containing protein n=1 Tax=Owenia fusiformis TaxID=6347 RepID=A0A8J1UF26_OWEFU|nr:unnamed protein product [Owenia fusiformis]